MIDYTVNALMNHNKSIHSRHQLASPGRHHSLFLAMLCVQYLVCLETRQLLMCVREQIQQHLPETVTYLPTTSQPPTRQSPRLLFIYIMLTVPMLPKKPSATSKIQTKAQKNLTTAIQMPLLFGLFYVEIKCITVKPIKHDSNLIFLNKMYITIVAV